MLRPKFLFVVALAAPAFAQTSQPALKSCVIASRHHYSMGEAWSSWRKPKPMDYIEGSFPTGMKFHAGIDEKIANEIQEKGGKLIVLGGDFKLPDLEDARRQCGSFVASPAETASTH